MEYTTLGGTGLRVSVAGLGCGGNSRLGLASGASEAEAVALVRRAIDLGVNLFDTAAAYGTEPVVGAALRGVPRDSVVISTKANVHRDGEVLPPEEVLASLDRSLRQLGTDHVDVFHLHGVPPALYDAVRERIVPPLLRERERGRLRHLGITETGPNDPRHLMLQRAVHDPVWEVVMLAFHMMNQNARATVFPHTRRNGIGTLLMFVVRSLFSIRGRLQATMAELAEAGRVPRALAETDDPLGFLIHEGGAASVIDAAYRYARHEPGADVILFGTGDAAHLERNVASILAPPLPEADVARLNELFGALEGVGLDLPIHRPRRQG
jgi:aryl-alcohol dehydrogenase-like predicted oxidoreductase